MFRWVKARSTISALEERQVTRAEVEEILRKAEENGLDAQHPEHRGSGRDCGDMQLLRLCLLRASRGTDVWRAGCRPIQLLWPRWMRRNASPAASAWKLSRQCLDAWSETLYEDAGYRHAGSQKITEHAWSKADWNVDYRENRKDVVDSGTAPCKTACPAHIAIQGYIKLAAQGKYMDALELIKKENPFPATCALPVTAARERVHARRGG